MAPKSEKKTLKIKQIGSPIRRPEKQKKMLIGLGLGKEEPRPCAGVFRLGVRAVNRECVCNHPTPRSCLYAGAPVSARL